MELTRRAFMKMCGLQAGWALIPKPLRVAAKRQEQVAQGTFPMTFPMTFPTAGGEARGSHNAVDVFDFEALSWWQRLWGKR